MDTHGLLAIERAVLSTVIYSEDFGIELKFRLEEKYFTHKYNAHVAKIIRKAIEKGVSLSLTALKLDDAVRGTYWEIDHLEILSANPLPAEIALQYYKELKKEYIKREARLV